MGCRGISTDSNALWGLIAGYITHPNVAGATVLNLGFKHAHPYILLEEIEKCDPSFNKPIVMLE